MYKWYFYQFFKDFRSRFIITANGSLIITLFVMLSCCLVATVNVCSDYACIMVIHVTTWTQQTKIVFLLLLHCHWSVGPVFLPHKKSQPQFSPRRNWAGKFSGACLVSWPLDHFHPILQSLLTTPNVAQLIFFWNIVENVIQL